MAGKFTFFKSYDMVIKFGGEKGEKRKNSAGVLRRP